MSAFVDFKTTYIIQHSRGFSRIVWSVATADRSSDAECVDWAAPDVNELYVCYRGYCGQHFLTWRLTGFDPIRSLLHVSAVMEY
jgi:hypothetical protein